MAAQLEDATSAAEHISTSTQSTSTCGIANLRGQNEGNFLTHDIACINMGGASASLTFGRVKGAILNEEICQKSKGEFSSSSSITRGRVANKDR